MLVMAGLVLGRGLSAFKARRGLSVGPPVWIPCQRTLAIFQQLLDDLDLPLYFMNSVIVAVLVTVSNLVFCSMLGYA
ncbi:sugar ABC transporter permease, partial [Streptomyces albidoflavus]